MSMGKNNDFEVFVSGGSTSVNEYRRAMAAPKSDLPELTEQQKFVAKKLGLSQEEYRRGVLADQMGETRILGRGRKLGEIVQKLLDGFDGGYRVNALKAEMIHDRWLIRIASPERDVVASIPRELADDVLDSGASDQVSRLRSYLQNSVRREQPVEGV
jgi:hypothetical protein